LKKIGKTLALVIAIPFTCGLGFILFYTVIMQIYINSLPAWMQPAANAWMQGVPQNSDYIPGIDVAGPVTAGATSVKWNGFSDPSTEVIEGSPFDFVALMGCTFGHPPGYSMNGGFHNGTDWKVVSGSNIYAIMGGQVVYAGFNADKMMLETSQYAAPGWFGKMVSVWGGLIVIENGDFQIWYAHLEEIDVAERQIVQRGDLLGKTDSLGNSTGPHMHLGILWNDHGTHRWIDPLQLQDDTLSRYGFPGIPPGAYTMGTCR
jgi:murein DD-endopeptidase MepM/ murein hydrolase activator NlpD